MPHRRPHGGAALAVRPRSRRRAVELAAARDRHRRRADRQPAASTKSETARRGGALLRGLRRAASRPRPSCFAASAPTSVVGDIPPLAFAAAARAGVPSVAVANFTWDWIYGDLPGVRPAARRTSIPAIRRAYAHGDARAAAAAARRLRADGRPSSRDIPLHRRPIDARPGGHAAAARHRRRARRSCCRRSAATASTCRSTRCGRRGRLHAARRRRASRRAGLRYEDLVAAADVVVSKPGYGIVSRMRRERHGAALHVARPLRRVRRARRGDAARPALPLSSRRTICCAGRWADAIDALLAQPAPR